MNLEIFKRGRNCLRSWWKYWFSAFPSSLRLFPSVKKLYYSLHSHVPHLPFQHNFNPPEKLRVATDSHLLQGGERRCCLPLSNRLLHPQVLAIIPLEPATSGSVGNCACPREQRGDAGLRGREGAVCEAALRSGRRRHRVFRRILSGRNCTKHRCSSSL